MQSSDILLITLSVFGIKYIWYLTCKLFNRIAKLACDEGDLMDGPDDETNVEAEQEHNEESSNEESSDEEESSEACKSEECSIEEYATPAEEESFEQVDESDSHEYTPADNRKIDIIDKTSKIPRDAPQKDKPNTIKLKGYDVTYTSPNEVTITKNDKDGSRSILTVHRKDIKTVPVKELVNILENDYYIPSLMW